MPITLEEIKAEHLRIADLIAAFQLQPQATEHRVESVVIPLAPDERFAGAILNDDGSLSHYLIKLPGESEDRLNWKGALSYADSRGGDAPTLRELGLLRANVRDEFEDAAYWSKDEYEPDTSYAWSQNFSYGASGISRKSTALRAVCVRRFIPSVI